ncbi:exonuclease SbcCD subunit D C-terminal domain-containing protein [Pseudoalteromonas sp. BDTF-M6]|uniref:exonuclease SbcCD subunit D C-terminal domain-containing protein n=1 Tax=Pseudoalteromonas sp. BDTF-M6 TaxID=2796132 RepID=UPI001BAF7A8C|nr:exonuclease SbcCD subunit D C-terminal domain-containing protein [Pseudoalteromonas sp. BDTF-M6]MBS3797559.1 exonuclease SbcCD subunit D C-terminal domain-containing protein [Pseudoalteromonas sp. BDTF-M6]
MRLLHTSDWHLGQLFYEHERIDEHQAFLSWLLTQLREQAVDILLISGDIYHTATPPSQAEKQFYQFIEAAKSACPELEIVVIAGNHDSAKRITTAQPLLAQFDTQVIGHFQQQAPELSAVNITKNGQHCLILALPYLRACDIAGTSQSYSVSVQQAYSDMLANSEFDTNTNIIAMGHLHARGAAVSEDSERALVIGGEDAIGADVFPKEANYVALGHLHKAQSVNGQDHIRYSGTPFAMSFSERNYRHQCLLVEVANGALQSVNPLYIPAFRKLHLLPEGGVVPLKELCEQLSALPDGNVQPGYIRVRLSSKELSPDFREQIDSALTGKNMLFCGIERVRAQQKSRQEEIELQDLTQLERLNAEHLLSVALEEHAELSEEDLNDEIKTLFSQLVADVEQELRHED